MIRLQNISYSAPSGEVKDLSFHLPEGKTSVILGPRRSGKSDFLKVCMGSIPATGGEVVFMGKPIAREEREAFGSSMRDIGFVTQRTTLIDNLTVVGNIGLPLSYHFGVEEKEMREMVSPLMEKFGIAELADAFPHEIPEDKAKLAQMARAVVMRPRLLVLDEPTAGDLDPDGFKRITDMVKNFQTEGITMLIATCSFTLTSMIDMECYFFLEGMLVPHNEAWRHTNQKVVEYLWEMQKFFETQTEETTTFLQASDIDLDMLFEEQ